MRSDREAALLLCISCLRFVYCLFAFSFEFAVFSFSSMPSLGSPIISNYYRSNVAFMCHVFIRAYSFFFFRHIGCAALKILFLRRIVSDIGSMSRQQACRTRQCQVPRHSIRQVLQHSPWLHHRLPLRPTKVHRIALSLTKSTFSTDSCQNFCISQKKAVTLQPKVAKVHENGAVTDYT